MQLFSTLYCFLGLAEFENDFIQVFPSKYFKANISSAVQPFFIPTFAVHHLEPMPDKDTHAYVIR